MMDSSRREGAANPGSPYPLGATLTGNGVNFAIYSEHATSVTLCLADGSGRSSGREFRLTARTGNVWHGFVEGIEAGQRYGYRIDGPWNPAEGHLFNPAKLLIDPYAAAIEGRVTWKSPVFGYRRDEHPDPSVMSIEDSAGDVPWSVVVDQAFDWQGDRPPRIPLADTVIYETHVKGTTRLHPDLPEDARGTYAGFAHPVMIDHFRQLGVTSIELLPVQAFVDEEFLGPVGLANYWGYNTIGFFAPEPRYARAERGNDQVSELKSTIRELHRHGFEVILDAVYNHTAEGGRLGPTLSFRGIDNRTYYRLDRANPVENINFSGTGNTINIEHPAVLRMVMDSLRMWVTEYHVDGFRFDLAPALGRDDRGFSANSAFFKAVFQDPVLASKKMIAEPWDIGPDGYQVGHFPVGWSEWNDRFRDAMRSFWLGHPVALGEFALRMTGSADLYADRNRGPLASINYVTCHDGFALADLVSYDEKHNEANNEGNNDGHNHNLSRNFGIEGPTDDQAIGERRTRARRNLLACTLFAHGVPMILGGDELSRTQLGNNNAYPQDNQTTWFDWTATGQNREFEAFVAHAIRCRAALPQLRRATFRMGEQPVGHDDDPPAWHEPDGADVALQDWGRQAPRALQLRLSGNGSGAGDVLLLFNAGEDPVLFSLPPCDGGWRPVLTTSSPNGQPAPPDAMPDSVTIDGESLMLLADRQVFPS
ncbi:MAG: glycogen debranching protein GlgX [Thermomicrobiales bacterium]|nr:glycogen debranching protein GlgX [Thermomicrobiales bacterium]